MTTTRIGAGAATAASLPAAAVRRRWRLGVAAPRRRRGRRPGLTPYLAGVILVIVSTLLTASPPARRSSPLWTVIRSAGG
jgi:hypothetical protein